MNEDRSIESTPITVLELESLISWLIAALQLMRKSLQAQKEVHATCVESPAEGVLATDGLGLGDIPWSLGFQDGGYVKNMQYARREPQRSLIKLEMRDLKLKTNDIVEISTKSREFVLNGSDPIRLKIREFLFLIPRHYARWLRS